MKSELLNVKENLELFNFEVETIFAEWGDGNIENLKKIYIKNFK